MFYTCEKKISNDIPTKVPFIIFVFFRLILCRVGMCAWMLISVNYLSFLDVQIFIAYDTFMHN